MHRERDAKDIQCRANYKQPKCPPIRDWLNKLQYSLPMEYFIDIKNDGLDVYLLLWKDILHFSMLLKEGSRKKAISFYREKNILIYAQS